MSKKVATKRKRIWHTNNVEIFLMVLAGAIFVFIFGYMPMFGILLAFKQADNALDVLGAMFRSDWAEMNGFYNFYRFLTDVDFGNIILNTLGFNILNLVICMPIPVILAVLFSEIKHPKVSKSIQFFMFLPHFISIVVWIGIIHGLVDDGYGGSVGVVNLIMKKLGMIDSYVNIKGDPKYSWALMIISGIIKGAGWGSIIYLAAIAGVDVELYDAAAIDGVNRWQKTRYITLPTVMPVFTLHLILNVSGVLKNDAGSMLLWQTESNLSRTEVLSTYILKYGINEMQYSYATALGLFNSVVGLILIVCSNWVSKKLTGEGAIF